MSPKKFRGLTKEGKWVYGWYGEVEGRHFIIPSFREAEMGMRPYFRWSDSNEICGVIKVLPETVGQFITKDKNGKDVGEGNDVWLKRGGSGPIKCIAIAGFKDWVWLYWKDHSTYHWEIAYFGDIEILEEQENE